jgi:hypothetical protein
VNWNRFKVRGNTFGQDLQDKQDTLAIGFTKVNMAAQLTGFLVLPN